MAITSENQLIDIEKIGVGYRKYIESLEAFITAGKTVYEAGATCTKKALSVDGGSMQPVLYELGRSISEMATVYADAANEFYSSAANLYNSQVAELNAYYQSLANQQNN